MIHNNNDDKPSTWMTPKTTQPFSRFCGLNQLADIVAHTHGSYAVPNQTTRGTQAVPADLSARWKKRQQIHEKSSWRKYLQTRDRHLEKQNMQKTLCKLYAEIWNEILLSQPENALP